MREQENTITDQNQLQSCKAATQPKTSLCQSGADCISQAVSVSVRRCLYQSGGVCISQAVSVSVRRCLYQSGGVCISQAVSVSVRRCLCHSGGVCISQAVSVSVRRCLCQSGRRNSGASLPEDLFSSPMLLMRTSLPRSCSMTSLSRSSFSFLSCLPGPSDPSLGCLSGSFALK